MTTPDSAQSLPYGSNGGSKGRTGEGTSAGGPGGEARGEARGVAARGAVARVAAAGGGVKVLDAKENEEGGAVEAEVEEMEVIPAPEIHTKLVIGRPPPPPPPPPSASEWFSGLFAVAGRRQPASSASRSPEHQSSSPYWGYGGSRTPTLDNTAATASSSFSEKAFQEHLELRGRAIEAVAARQDGEGRGGYYMGR